MFVTAAVSGRVLHLPDRAVWHAEGSYVPLPPSQRPKGRDRWVWVPRFGRLPEAGPVVEALHRVHLHEWEVGANDRPTLPAQQV